MTKDLPHFQDVHVMQQYVVSLSQGPEKPQDIGEDLWVPEPVSDLKTAKDEYREALLLLDAESRNHREHYSEEEDEIRCRYWVETWFYPIGKTP